MKKLIIATLLLGSTSILSAQKTMKLPAVYKPVKTEMYKKGWIDFNKNGIKDVYEDPTAPIDARIEDLLSQMNLNGDPLWIQTGTERCITHSRMETNVVERWYGSYRRASQWIPAMGLTPLG